LAGLHFEYALLRFHSQRPAEYYREFVEVRLLARLGPSRWTSHVGDADA
jgi:hypothetical protein